ncbi:hypothetical protein ABT300_27205 [Streptomyces sp. NPDC001027]|uniref:hypothetical protein n=1 Tax=Streptomyces sp. NPDC001027 TaxID=3154771 RepID=UPI003316A716
MVILAGHNEGISAVAEVRVALDVGVGADALSGGRARRMLVEGLGRQHHGGLPVGQFLG